jgi:hypothetical protein
MEFIEVPLKELLETKSKGQSLRRKEGKGNERGTVESERGWLNCCGISGLGGWG